MKKRLILMLLTAGMALTDAAAQEVYQQIHQRAATTAADPQANAMLRELSRFKTDALDYMAMTMKAKMPDSTATFLDKQALAMNMFMSLYMNTLVTNNRQPAAYQVKLMKLFMDASYSNPLFNDPDKETVLSYYADGNSLARFSLDTDWQRAYVAVSYQLKKKEEE